MVPVDLSIKYTGTRSALLLTRMTWPVDTVISRVPSMAAVDSCEEHCDHVENVAIVEAPFVDPDTL